MNKTIGVMALASALLAAPAFGQAVGTVNAPIALNSSGQPVSATPVINVDPTTGNPITPPAAPSTYTLMTNATSAGATTVPAGTYKLLLPATFNGAMVTLSITSANGTVSTFAYTSVPSPIPCFPIAAGDTVSAAASGGTPTGNTVFAGATRCGSGDVSPAAFTQAALVASGKTAVTGTLTATGTSAAFTPIAGREMNFTIDGTFIATVQIERLFVGDATWHVVFTNMLRQSVPPSFTLTESEVGVQYRLNCTAYTSGTATYRISQ